jgi:hypothetical protein
MPAATSTPVKKSAKIGRSTNTAMTAPAISTVRILPPIGKNNQSYKKNETTSGRELPTSLI